LDPDKIKKVIDLFFESLKSKDNETLETGLTQNSTIDVLKNATVQAIEQKPERFEIYVKWMLQAAMYLLDEENELSEIE
jgi:hypothetical protein